MQQIEGVEDDAIGLPTHSRPERLKVRGPVFVLDDGFTVNDCCFAAETGSGTNDAGMVVAPIISIPAKDTHLATLNHHLRAVAIVFDFVNPVLALWRLLDRGSKLWLENLMRGVTRNMERFSGQIFSGEVFSSARLRSL
jgi:hypothetical protein